MNSSASRDQVKVPFVDMDKGVLAHVKEGCDVNLNLVDPIAQAVGLNSLLGEINQPSFD